MTTDYRERLTRELEVLFQTSKDTDASIVSNQIVKVIANYEITERCTDLIPVDNGNEKTLKRYSACLHIDGKSDKTIYQYIRTCRKLSEEINKPFEEMGTYDIRYFLAMEKDRGIANSSLENTRAYISAFFQWMVDEQMIAINPMVRINTIKCHEEIRLAFSDVEIDKLRCACVTKKERAIVELLLSSGIRVSELTGMKENEIDFQALTVRVVNGKGDKERTTYITPVAATHIKEYIAEKSPEDNEYLFYNNKHTPIAPNGVRYILNELGKRAGVDDIYPHRFRRTLATELARRGMDIREIQKILGHKKIETTLLYVNTDSEAVHSSYKKYIG